jgi:secondary thiamine-phosphate synthase enzyme
MFIKKSLSTPSKQSMVEITSFIRAESQKKGFQNGRILVFVPHTTAGVTINENADPDVHRDILTAMDSLELEKLPFRHREGNSPAHVKSVLTGSSVELIVINGKLKLGTWQGVFFCEYDGPRNREFYLYFS